MGERFIPVDDRFVRWLLAQINRMKDGSIHLEIVQGKLRSIGCHGHRFISASDILEEPQDA